MSPSSNRRPSDAEPSGERLALRDDVRLQVEAEQLDATPVHARQEVVQREREVRPPGAEVHDAEVAVRQRRDDVVDELDEAVDLPELRPSRRADATLGRLDAELDEVRNRLALGEEPPLGAVVREGRRRAWSAARRRTRGSPRPASTCQSASGSWKSACR